MSDIQRDLRSRAGVDRLLSRRDLMRNAGISAAVMAAAATFHPPEVVAAIRARFGSSLGTNTRSTTTLVTQSDFEFLGFYRLPTSGVPSFSGNAVNGSVGSRRVGNQFRIFIDANFPQYQTCEFIVPDTAPSLTLNSSTPRLQFHLNWGNTWIGHTVNAGGSIDNGILLGGKYWDSARNGIWQSYQVNYILENQATILFTQLNDTNGSIQKYGPWRTQVGGVKSAHAFMEAPAAYASSYLNGRRAGMITKGAGGSNHSKGPSYISIDPDAIDPFTRPPNYTPKTAPTWDIPGSTVMFYPNDHRYPMPPGYFYRVCGGYGDDPNTPEIEKYECSVNGVPTVSLGDPEAIWATQNTAVGTGDTILGSVFLDLPDRRGIIQFGQLGVTNPLFTPVGDDYIHRGYSGLTTIINGDYACCHGQIDSEYGSTGPFSTGRMSFVWIVDPDEMALTIGGPTTYSLGGFEAFPFQDIWGHQYVSGINHKILQSGALFDAVTRRIYVFFQRYDDTISTNANRPAVGVFQVN